MRRCSILIALLASLAIVTPASAAPPLHETFVVNVPEFADLGCGFPVLVQPNGIIRVTTFFNANGTPVRRVITITEGVFSATASANGKTLDYIAPNPVIEDLVSGTAIIVGLRARLSPPLGGTLLIDAGRVVYNASGEVVFEAGTHALVDGDTDELCAFFADP
jgi:hypothetical protein